MTQTTEPPSPNSKTTGQTTEPLNKEQTSDTTESKPKFFQMHRVCLIMQDILDRVPVNEEYAEARQRLKYQLDSIPYTAPESLGNSWLDLYDWLLRYMPDTRDTSAVELGWAKQIEEIWRSAINNPASLLTDQAN